MSSFQVGDRVQCPCPEQCEKVGTVVKVMRFRDTYQVKWEGMEQLQIRQGDMLERVKDVKQDVAPVSGKAEEARPVGD